MALSCYICYICTYLTRDVFTSHHEFNFTTMFEKNKWRRAVSLIKLSLFFAFFLYQNVFLKAFRVVICFYTKVNLLGLTRWLYKAYGSIQSTVHVNWTQQWCHLTLFPSKMHKYIFTITLFCLGVDYFCWKYIFILKRCFSFHLVKWSIWLINCSMFSFFGHDTVHCL